MKKYHLKNYLEKYIPPFAFFSFTETFRLFYLCNFAAPPKIYSSKGRQRDDAKVVHNLSNYFRPDTLFFFSCKRSHIMSGYDWRKDAERPLNKKFYRHTPIPFEVSWADSNMESHYSTDDKLQFRTLLPALQKAWTVFLGILINAEKTNRIFYRSEWSNYNEALNENTDTQEVAQKLSTLSPPSKAAISVVGVKQYWVITRDKDGSNPVDHQNLYYRGFRRYLEDTRINRRERVKSRRDILIREMCQLSRSVHGSDWKKKLLKQAGACTKPI